GFSDVINDQQPPWSDVTYFRLYEDHPPEAAELLDEPGRQPPYVLFDTIKSNLFPGRKPIRALWNRIANILPFYQRFGIDGARVDMAHALPRELERMILDRPRRRDPDFCFFAEDLSHERTAAARKAGYNVVLGPSWYCQPRAHEGLMHKLVTDLSKLKAPILAAAETPDTPRAVVRKGAAVFSRQAVVVNMFLPNTVPMINSGMEIFERQPMNLGLDVADKPGRFALPKSDPFYGKLAFFDPVVLHWANRGGQEMVDLIAWAAAIRQQYLHTITRKSAWFAPKLTANAKHILATGFRLSSSREKAGSTKSSDNYKSLIMLANVDFDRSRRTTVVDLPGTTSKNTAASESDVLLELQSSPVPKWRNGRLTLFLPPGDVKIIRV
ncbi:MAG: alpha-amylase, partial [Phycisphaerae bacterium]|nr:alpha-amylase [Phycisphaerae bacterium]